MREKEKKKLGRNKTRRKSPIYEWIQICQCLVKSNFLLRFTQVVRTCFQYYTLGPFAVTHSHCFRSNFYLYDFYENSIGTCLGFGCTVHLYLHHFDDRAPKVCAPSLFNMDIIIDLHIHVYIHHITQIFTFFMYALQFLFRYKSGTSKLTKYHHHHYFTPPHFDRLSSSLSVCALSVSTMSNLLYGRIASVFCSFSFYMLQIQWKFDCELCGSFL